jgi:hypothetical protein
MLKMPGGFNEESKTETTWGESELRNRLNGKFMESLSGGDL